MLRVADEIGRQLLIAATANRNTYKTAPSFQQLIRNRGVVYANAVDAYAGELKKWVKRSQKEITRNWRATQQDYVPDVAQAERQAHMIALQICPVDKWHEQLIEINTDYLGSIALMGAAEEYFATMAVLRAMGDEKTTTAQEIVDRLEIPVPTDFSLGPLPEDYYNAALLAVDEAFREDYWRQVPRTTRWDAEGVINRGIADGWSHQRMARELNDWTNGEYSIKRAMNVARTEAGNALNAGHVAVIDKLSQDTGVPMGVEWVSVMGRTTRVTHANVDGEQQPAAEPHFILAGYDVPWPAHHSLPARERCHCQCTVVSTFLLETLEGDNEDVRREAMRNMPVETLVNQDNLIEKQRKIAGLSVEDAQAKKLVWLEKKADWQKWQWELAEAQTQNIMGRVTDDELQHMTAQYHRAKEEMQEARWQLLKQAEKDTAKATRHLRQPQANRQALKGKMPTKAEIAKNSEAVQTTNEFRHNAEKARRWLEQVYNASETDPNKLKFRFWQLADGDRAFHRAAKMSPFTSRTLDDGVYFTQWDDPRIAVHEIGHHLEAQTPGLTKRANEFRDYRVKKAGKPDINMKEEFGGGYESWETGNEDDFAKAFNGNRNSAAYAGKKYSSGSTEIISMGLELMYQNPVGFAKRDPEWFRFIAGVLDGTIR
jgi:hypothetical protein